MIKLGASIRGTGYNISAWRHPDVDAAASESINHYIALARLAEAACFDMVFFADALAVRMLDDPKGAAERSDRDVELDPSTILPALAVVTKRVGLVSTASTTYNEPYHLARRYASLDHISGGRAGWNAVTSLSEREAQNFNLEKHWSKSDRYERANEFLEVVTGLWAGWQKDALLWDKVSGRFYDGAKVRDLNHRGKYFQVRGPLTLSRTPQGRPLIVQAGSSNDGLDLAGRFADVVYTIPRTLEKAIAGRAELRARARKFGRADDEILVMPGVQIVTGRTEKEAREKYEVLLDLVDPIVTMSLLTRQFGKLFTMDMLDEPVPAGDIPEGAYSVAMESIKIARENKWTVRRLCKEAGMSQHMSFCGTADKVAEQMASWFESGACDGFNILPSYSPGSLADVVEHIVPRLQDRGMFRRSYERSTLRENLGLRALD